MGSRRGQPAQSTRRGPRADSWPSLAELGPHFSLIVTAAHKFITFHQARIIIAFILFEIVRSGASTAGLASFFRLWKRQPPGVRCCLVKERAWSGWPVINNSEEQEECACFYVGFYFTRAVCCDFSFNYSRSTWVMALIVFMGKRHKIK